MELSCIVLAGGKSRRLGRDKVRELLGNQSLLDRVLSRLDAFNSQIILVKAKDSSLPGDITSYPRLKVVEDIFPGAGTSGGIYSGLFYSKTFYNLVVACDMPFLNTELLHYIVAVSEGYDLAAYKNGDKFEPLHAVYSKNCLVPLNNSIRQNRLRVIELLSLVKVRYITREEIERFDPQYLSFFNINTEAELKAGREMAAKNKLDIKQ